MPTDNAMSDSLDVHCCVMCNRTVVPFSLCCSLFFGEMGRDGEMRSILVARKARTCVCFAVLLREKEKKLPVPYTLYTPILKYPGRYCTGIYLCFSAEHSLCCCIVAAARGSALSYSLQQVLWSWWARRHCTRHARHDTRHTTRLTDSGGRLY